VTPASTVIVAHAVHPRKRQHHLVAGRARRAAADEAGVAALRDERDARFGAGRDDRGDLGGRTGPHDGERGAAVAAAPVGQVRGGVRGVGEDLAGADDRGKPREQGCAGVRHGPA
jgi:hypothetical protein